MADSLNRLTIEHVEKMLENFPHSYPDDGTPERLARQLLDTMRENERLRAALQEGIKCADWKHSHAGNKEGRQFANRSKQLMLEALSNKDSDNG